MDNLEGEQDFEDLEKKDSDKGCQKGCPATVHETVCVKAKVTITPHVKVDKVKYYCVGEPIIWKKCEQSESGAQSCSFEVGQKICVEIPLTFSASTRVKPKGIICGTPKNGKCCNRNKDGKCCKEDRDTPKDGCCKEERDTPKDGCCKEDHDTPKDECSKENHSKPKATRGQFLGISIKNALLHRKAK